MKKVFSEYNLFKATKISWWEKLLLLFRPVNISHDPDYGDDPTTYCYTKTLFGKIYLIDMKQA